MKNYRAAITLLYSFVIYDLLKKLEQMSNESSPKAVDALRDIKKLMSDDAKYSLVERKITDFFLENCQLYFDNFQDDIEYLKKLRNRCAHLKIEGEGLFSPHDYHVRMLISSMYDNILSVKAPFITDIFSIAKDDIESISEKLIRTSATAIKNDIKSSITNNYLIRLTDDSLEKSYCTILKLLFTTINDDTEKYVNGLFAFAFTMTDFILKKGHSELFSRDKVKNQICKINTEELKNCPNRITALAQISIYSPKFIEAIEFNNIELYNFLEQQIIQNPDGFQHFDLFYPHQKDSSSYEYFTIHQSLHSPLNIKEIYSVVKGNSDFNLFEFLKIMVYAIPCYAGFDSADAYMSFLLAYKEQITKEELKELIKVYNCNDQCTRRNRHHSDIEKINAYLNEISDNSEDQDSKENEKKSESDLLTSEQLQKIAEQ